MKKALLAGLVLTTSLSAFANKTIQCVETSANKNGSREIFTIELNDKNQILKIDENGWDEKSNKALGGGTFGYYDKKPLKPEVTKNSLEYSYTIQDEGDIDYPPPPTDITLDLSPTLTGPAEFTAMYDDGHSGSDHFDLNCKMK